MIFIGPKSRQNQNQGQVKVKSFQCKKIITYRAAIKGTEHGASVRLTENPAKRKSQSLSTAAGVDNGQEPDRLNWRRCGTAVAEEKLGN